MSHPGPRAEAAGLFSGRPFQGLGRLERKSVRMPAKVLAIIRICVRMCTSVIARGWSLLEGRMVSDAETSPEAVGVPPTESSPAPEPAKEAAEPEPAPPPSSEPSSRPATIRDAPTVEQLDVNGLSGSVSQLVGEVRAIRGEIAAGRGRGIGNLSTLQQIYSGLNFGLGLVLAPLVIAIAALALFSVLCLISSYGVCEMPIIDGIRQSLVDALDSLKAAGK